MAVIDFVGDISAMGRPARPTLSVRQPPMPESDPYAPANGPMSNVGQFLGTDQFSQMMLNGQPSPQQTATPEAAPQQPSAAGRRLAPLPTKPPVDPPQHKRGGVRDFLGNLGDALLVGAGGKATYGPKVEREQFVEAVSRYMRDPNDPGAFSAMLSNPGYAEMAVKLRKNDQEWRTGQVEQSRKVDERAMQVLGAAHDQASYDRARNIVGQLYRSVNRDPASLGLPDAYSPEITTEIRLRGTAPEDQLGDARLNRRLDWDITDDQVDNDRADLNTDSLIEDRTERRSEAQRYHGVQSGNTRRGQDIRSTDTRRGQDRRPVGRRGGGAAPTATGPNGEKVQWNGKAWVPVK